MKISVGPVPSHWGQDKIIDFYRDLAQSPADDVYIGETVCPERSCYSTDFLGRLSDDLADAGKQVFASSLILVKDSDQVPAFRKLADRVKRIEINSPAFLALAPDYDAVSGATLHIHNSAAANAMAKRSIDRIVPTYELAGRTLTSIAKTSTVPVEVVVHGHIPIAISADCQTARSFQRNGDGCDCLCSNYPEGMVLHGADRPIFRIEGPQTLSAATYCLVEYLDRLSDAGVDTIRILPQPNHTTRIIGIYRDVLDAKMTPREALKNLETIHSLGLCNGWFLGKAGWDYQSPNASHANLRDAAPVTDHEKTDPESEPQALNSDFLGVNDQYQNQSTDGIIEEVTKLAQMMNTDQHFLDELGAFKNTTVLLSASDTGREFLIKLDKKRGVAVQPYAGEPFKVKIRATEQVLWDVFSGKMDADAAFFSGKATVSGSIITAFRVKNKFLSLLQKHFARNLAAKKDAL